MMRHKFWQILLLLLAPFPTLNAQQPSGTDSLLLELENISAFEEASALQASLNNDFEAGALEGMSSREVPNIVSFVTAEEIKNTGARDLIDVLRLVPGFDFASDVEMAIGPVLRGNWAMEGKILLMVDGIEMNELAFQSLFFSHHFPVDLIERVEIIRGPGSAIYGGTAEYGVINVITKGKKGIEGIHLYTTYAHLTETFGRRTAGLSLRKSIGKTMVDLTGSLGDGNRSDDDYVSFYKDTVPLSEGRFSYVKPSFLNIGISSGHFEARAVYDDYQWNTNKYSLQNKQFSLMSSYHWKVNEKLSVTPKMSYTNQLPWHFKKQLSKSEEDWFFYKINTQRINGTLSINYKFTRRFSVLSGIETQYLFARDLLHKEGEEGNFGDSPEVSYQNYSVFGQTLWKSYFANLTAGLRYDYRKGFGGAIVPRIAATKHLNKWHVKLLYSHAYRMPGIENMNLAVGELKPEFSTVAEAELGYQFTKDMVLSVNAFRMNVKDIIIYGFDLQTLEETYVNESKTGSSGVEANLQVVRPRWKSQVTYSYYVPVNGNTVEDYKVEDREDLYLGIAAHKITFNGTYHLSNKLHLNSTAIWNSERFGYTGFTDDSYEEYELSRFAPYLLLNTFLRYENLLPGWHIGAGIYNITDFHFGYIQPYAGENAPAPSPGREWVLKMQYEIPFGKK